MSTLATENFDRIWLEPRDGADPYVGRQWCQDNQWGEDGVEYVHADLVSDLRRAASALLDTLWQHAWSGSRTHEENWQEMDRRFPQARWLHDALKAEAPPPSQGTLGTAALAKEGK